MRVRQALTATALLTGYVVAVAAAVPVHYQLGRVASRLSTFGYDPALDWVFAAGLGLTTGFLLTSLVRRTVAHRLLLIACGTGVLLFALIFTVSWSELGIPSGMGFGEFVSVNGPQFLALPVAAAVGSVLCGHRRPAAANPRNQATLSD